MSQLNEYEPGTQFTGVVGRTPEVSTPAWPRPVRADDGAPNVVMIVLDDVGFAQLGCFGGPVDTPTMDRLAERGLRYDSFHTTALCSPSRASLLTGRNHHSNGLACITEGSTGYPGSNGYIPFENGFLSEIFQREGYNTYAVGKWHLTPADQMSAAGPYDRWPLGRGFERFYGFLGGETHQFYPDLVHDNHQVEPPKTPEQGYHLTEDLVDRSISFIADAKQVAPNKPFFLYFAPGAMHAPHHVTPEWIEPYRGRFDDGWDAYRERAFARQQELGVVPADAELSRHDPDVAPWDSLSDDERRLYARMMEVYAGFLSHTDHEIGRLLDFIEQLGELDNTLVILTSDNGASSEGGLHGSVNENLFFNNVPESLEENLGAIDRLGDPTTFCHYPWGWTFAGNTPFRRWKRETYRGGISDPLIVSWPDRITAHGEVRNQFVHAIDILPTVLDACGITAPNTIRGVTQSPIEGVSFAHTFGDASAASLRTTQYFEMMGHRSLYHDGWRAVCPWPGPSFAESGRSFGDPIDADLLTELDSTGWELYHVAEDFAENHDIAGEHRDRLIAMIAQWYVEAGRYNVLPIDSRGVQRSAELRPTIAPPRDHYVYYPHTQSVPFNSAVNVLNRTHSITADVDIPTGGADGILLLHGGNEGGYAFYIKDGLLHWVHNYVARSYPSVVSTETVPEGRRLLRFEFEATGPPDFATGRGTPGVAQLYIDGRLVGQADVPVTTLFLFSISAGLRVGSGPGSPVCPGYEPPFEFPGTIHSIAVDVSGELIEDDELTVRMLMARQ